MKGREKELEFFLVGSLEKVFPDQRPEEWKEGEKLCILKGETPAIQLVYFRRSGGGYPTVPRFACRVSGFPAQARLREVELVPSAFPCFEQVDDNYLRTEPGMFPDLLKPCPDGWITPRAGQYRALWIDFPDTSGVPAGEYRVEITLMPETEGMLGNGQSWRWDEEMKQRVFSLTPMEEGETKPLCLTLEVSEEALPKQSLIHTEWFHSDCVADYYQTEVFGEAHWKALESQIAMAAEIGINTLLTPVFTPPLDTAVGSHRTGTGIISISACLRDGAACAGNTASSIWRCPICSPSGERRPRRRSLSA